MADEIYQGSNKAVSSSYLYTTLQNLKTQYINNKATTLSVDGRTITLKDANNNVLSEITTQDTDTTYDVASTTTDGLMSKEMVETLNNLKNNAITFETTELDLLSLT